MAGDGMRRIPEDKPFDLFNLGEVCVRVHAQKSASRTVLLTTVSRRLFARSGFGRVEASAGAQVALDREQVIRTGLFLIRIARAHRDRVVRTLRRAVAAADAGLRINVYQAAGEAADGPRRTTRQALRILAVHADRRVKQTLET